MHNKDDLNFIQQSRFDYPFHVQFLKSPCEIYRVVGSCDGLLCLSDDKLSYTSRLCFWNPCVRKLVELPLPNVTYTTHGGFDVTIGFGLDPKTNDYKVVRVVTLLDGLDLENSRPEFEIYSLSTGEWRMLNASLAPQAFVNGALHWVALGGLMITTFNIYLV